ncbi:MAG: DUF362 domain-containing protein [Phycisphaerae bacterium]|nr:DUF362 domain-containing protein [Phycisphaerae bacterium]
MAPDSDMTAVVAVKACCAYEPAAVRAAIEGQFQLLGGVERFVQRGQRVLIKPNLIVPKSVDIPAQTHPEVIYAVAEIVKDAGAIPWVGDSPAWSQTRGCLKALGIDERLEKLGAEIVNLDRPVRMRIENTPVGISRAVLEADVILNVPKLKAHQQLGATFAFKNMYGCVCGLGGKEKAYWHFARGKEFEPFCRMVVGIYQKLNPVLTIIDGIVGMEGQGPINGQPRQVGYLVAGVDPAACERVCCDLVGFDPRDLPLLMTAEKMGVGISSSLPVKIVGDVFDKPVCGDFQSAQLTPLRFTFPHICKSIAKQCVILLKSLFS